MAALMKGDVMRDVAIRLLAVFKQYHENDIEYGDKLKQ